MTIREIEQRFHLDRAEVFEMLDSLIEKGYNVHSINGVYRIEAQPEITTKQDPRFVFESDDEGRYLFGGVADTHLGSKYERLDVLEDLYNTFEQQGVPVVFHGGNMIEGEAHFNRYDVHVYGMDRQVRYLVENYPQRDGVVTYAIHGDDHEGWYAKREGIDMGRYIERAFRDAGRDDWYDLGFLEADVVLRHKVTGAEATLRVVHPGGGTAYALSYQAQKLVESYGGADKPAVLFLGHWHKMFTFNYRNVWIVGLGCVKDQDVFMRKKRLAAHVGGVIVELEQDPETGAVVGCRADLRRYFNKGYYAERNGRWSMGGDVVHPKRGR